MKSYILAPKKLNLYFFPFRKTVEPVPVPAPKEDQHRSIRARMIEAEMSKPRGFRRGDPTSSSSSSTSRSRYLEKKFVFFSNLI